MESDTVITAQIDEAGENRKAAINSLKKIDQDLNAAYLKAQNQGIILDDRSGYDSTVDVISMAQEVRSIELSSEIFGLETYKHSIQDVLHTLEISDHGEPFSPDLSDISDQSNQSDAYPSYDVNDKQDKKDLGSKYSNDIILLSINRSITEISDILTRMFVHMDNIETRLAQIEDNFEKNYRPAPSDITEDGFGDEIKKPRSSRSRKSPNTR